MDLKKPLGIIGSGLLFVGAFMPIISVPIMGSMNFMTDANIWGISLLLLAIVSFLLTVLDKPSYLWLTGCTSLLIIVTKFIQLSSSMGGMLDSIGEEETGLAKVFAEGFASAVQLQWGWAVLLLGSCCIVASAAIRIGKNGSVEAYREPLDRLQISFFGVLEQFKTNPKLKVGLVVGIAVLMVCVVVVILFQNLGRCPFGTEEVTETYTVLGEVYTKEWCRKQDEEGNYISHGQIRKLFPSGSVREEGEYRNNKMHGKWVLYSENGQKMGEKTYDDGIENGIRTVWHENGQKKKQRTVSNGKLIGPYMVWDKTGTPIEGVKDFSDNLISCNEGGVQACTYVSDRYREGKSFIDTSRIDEEQFLEEACNMDLGFVCAIIYDLLQNKSFPNSSSYLIKAVKLWEKKCYSKSGDSLQNASGCFNAGNIIILLDGKQMKRKGIKMIKRACKLGSTKACDYIQSEKIQ